VLLEGLGQARRDRPWPLLDLGRRNGNLAFKAQADQRSEDLGKPRLLRMIEDLNPLTTSQGIMQCAGHVDRFEEQRQDGLPALPGELNFLLDVGGDCRCPGT